MRRYRSARSLLVTGAFVGVAAVVGPAACSEVDTVDRSPGPTTGGSGGGTSTTDTTPTTTTPITTTSTTSDGGSGIGICLLNDCTADAHCAACADGRTTCIVAEGRCVACDANDPSVGCPPGQSCSAYGLCIPEGLTCPVDENAVPNFNCGANPDCQACSPLHQVCAGSPPRCVACEPANTQHCSQSDVCTDGRCTPRCPAECSTNSDCVHCGPLGSEAHLCYEGHCAACNDDTNPCPNGLACVHGACVLRCGLPDSVTGDCVANGDCDGCGGEEASGSWLCIKEVGAGPNDHGTCGPPANGCSDLGSGALVMPEPWASASSLCSTEPDCSELQADVDIGQLVQSMVGSDELNIGFASLPICSFTVPYDVSRCAELGIQGDIACGICVPCETDADCPAVEVAPLTTMLFCDDPLAPLAGAFLFDLLWGRQQETTLHFFCKPVAAGYGICEPCPSPTASCTATDG